MPSINTANGNKRLNMTLSPKASRALEEAMEITTEDAHTVVKSALIAYATIQRIVDNGGNVYAQERVNGPMQQIWLFT